MKTPISRTEFALLLGLCGAVLLAWLGPVLAQPAHYHAFADQRAWYGLPCTMDLLTNLPFALAGIWGLIVLQRWPVAGVQKALAWLFFCGLVLTGLCSGYYHWQPDDAGLVVDRLGMVLAFAGLLGLAGAEQISARAGWVTAGAVLLVGPLSVLVWAASGNLLPWLVLQGGGMLLISSICLRKQGVSRGSISWGTVIVFYALAKALEFGDHAVFAWTQGWVSGHSLKHLMAALAAWPVLAVMHNVAQANQRSSCAPRPVQPMGSVAWK